MVENPFLHGQPLFSMNEEFLKGMFRHSLSFYVKSSLDTENIYYRN